LEASLVVVTGDETLVVVVGAVYGVHAVWAILQSVHMSMIVDPSEQGSLLQSIEFPVVRFLDVQNTTACCWKTCIKSSWGVRKTLSINDNLLARIGRERDRGRGSSTL